MPTGIAVRLPDFKRRDRVLLTSPEAVPDAALPQKSKRAVEAAERGTAGPTRKAPLRISESSPSRVEGIQREILLDKD
jgi:hypothetical protein